MNYIKHKAFKNIELIDYMIMIWYDMIIYFFIINQNIYCIKVHCATKSLFILDIIDILLLFDLTTSKWARFLRDVDSKHLSSLDQIYHPILTATYLIYTIIFL